MRILIGNLTSTIETPNANLLKALVKRYSFRVPGSEYTKSFKKKQWDGKKYYINKHGKFKTGLLSRILKDLETIKCTSELIYENNKKFDINVCDVENFNYYDYQREAIQKVITDHRCIISSPVGSGKTLMMAGILKSFEGFSAIILFREKGILNQTYKFLKSCGIQDLGINSGDGYIPGKIMLSTVQSIDRVLDDHYNDNILMVDEAHQFCKGDVTKAAIESFPSARIRVAFTATPPSPESDIHGRMVLEGAFGPVYHTMSMQDLIKEGVIANPIITILSNTPTSVNENLTYQEQYQKHIVNSIQRNNRISDLVQKIYESRKNSKVLILVKDINHLESLKNLIPNSYSIEGKDSIEDRYSIIKQFVGSKDPCCIIGTNVLQTGININEITHMINARGLKGEIPTIQGLGRGVRKADGKMELFFYDFYDEVPYLQDHSEERIDHYEELKFNVTYEKNIKRNNS